MPWPAEHYSLHIYVKQSSNAIVLYCDAAAATGT